MTLSIQDGTSIIFTLETNATKRNQARGTWFATKFGIATTDPNFARRTQGIEGGINATIGTTHRTTEIRLFFVDGVFHAHDWN